MKEKIYELYFNEHLKQCEIAKQLNISKSEISKILNKSELYINEKEQRKKENKIKHNKEIQKRVEESRKVQQFKSKVDDLILKNFHNQAAQELSGRKHLNNESYRKWNTSAYKFNPSKNRFEFDGNLGRSYDVPKFIKNEKINLKGW